MLKNEHLFYEEKIQGNEIAKAWIDFAKEVIEMDEIKFEEKDLAEFGYKMMHVIEYFGFAENMLWQSVTPSGTEDRTWVRAFLGTQGLSEYQNILKDSNPDAPVAKLAVEQMEIAYIRSL